VAEMVAQPVRLVSQARSLMQPIPVARAAQQVRLSMAIAT